MGEAEKAQENKAQTMPPTRFRSEGPGSECLRVEAVADEGYAIWIESDAEDEGESTYVERGETARWAAIDALLTESGVGEGGALIVERASEGMYRLRAMPKKSVTPPRVIVRHDELVWEALRRLRLAMKGEIEGDTDPIERTHLDLSVLLFPPGARVREYGTEDVLCTVEQIAKAVEGAPGDPGRAFDLLARVRGVVDEAGRARVAG